MSDEVDRILAAWAVEAPGLDVSPMGVLSRVSRLNRHLDWLRAQAFDAHQLELWEFDVLTALRRSGPPYVLPPAELIHDTLSTSATMTNRIDRLSERGLVVREPNQTDRRSILVRLTDEGTAKLLAALGDLLEAERAVLAAIDPAEAAVLAALLRQLLVQFEQR